MSGSENPSLVETSRLTLYKYDKLSSSDSVRLLILRGAENRDQEIYCELVEQQVAHTSTSTATYPLPSPDQSRLSYEALSWCWGDDKRDKVLRIHRRGSLDGQGQSYRFMIPGNLESALRALRHADQDRPLWIDAICINQADFDERNKQVPRMKHIYGDAINVCVWIGEADETSSRAFEFIREIISNLWEFDKMCTNPTRGKDWNALSRLMQRPWFSRRWVVQEIALAQKAWIYCGKDNISWQDFANAVSLFVEVESERMHMSSVMRQAVEFGNVDDFFGNVLELGAAVLIEATSNLFRYTKGGRKEPLLQLSHLVCKYTVFEARQPRDTIYALLAIARDAAPQTQRFSIVTLRTNQGYSPAAQLIIRALGRDRIQNEMFRVDYKLPVVDVFMDFVLFAIRKSDPVRALNIICRPWAPRFTRKDDQAGFHEALDGALGFNSSRMESSTQDVAEDEVVPMPSWIASQSEKAFVMKPIGGQENAPMRMERINSDPLVGLPGVSEDYYRAAGSIGYSKDELRFKKVGDTLSLFVEGFVIDRVRAVAEYAQLGNIPRSWLDLGRWHNTKKPPPEDFWRTLVANRGPHGKNPPAYYPTACMKAVQNLTYGEILSTMNVSKLIQDGGSTIVAGFLRRAQAVVFGRSLMRTTDDRLGLVPEKTTEGDYICILFGCTVPVVLRKLSITEEQRDEYAKAARQGLEEAEKSTATLVTKIRRQQLQRRLQDKWLQRRLWLAKMLKALRFLFAIFLVWYFKMSARHQANTELALVMAALTLTTTTRFTNLRNWEKMLRLSWFLETQTMIRFILFGLVSVHLRDFNSWDADRRIIILVTFVLFPRLILIPLGLQNALTVARVNLLLGNFSDKYKKLAGDDWVVHACAKRLWRGWRSKPQPTRLNPDGGNREFWVLVGACYVHGIMDGEATEWQTRTRTRRQVFDIR
jgi:Heterokaryon incompatibility protein (HET)